MDTDLTASVVATPAPAEPTLTLEDRQAFTEECLDRIEIRRVRDTKWLTWAAVGSAIGVIANSVAIIILSRRISA